ncbi:MAG: protein sphX [Phycisphaerae bacterium]|nr:MAG: protein sphX [Phycisphaerae bacterium]
MTRTLLLAAALAVPMATHAQTQVVKVDGSSTVYPITEAVAEDFQAANKGIKVTVGISGTGGGFKKFTRGETDISSASRPIKKEEIDECAKNGVEFIELPVAFDALTIVINKSNTWATNMTVADLKKMWEPEAQAKITKWNQINPAWPDAEIQLFGPGADSGTFEYFTEAVNGKAKASRGDYTPSEDDNTLVKGVEGSKFALGYFGMSYYLAHKDKLTAVNVAWDKNKATTGPVSPTTANVLNGSYAPLSRPLFIYVNKKSVETRPEVRKFVEFFLAHAKELTTEVKYVPLPDAAYEIITSRFAKMQTGSVFGGEAAVGMKIEDILAREAK